MVLPACDNGVAVHWGEVHGKDLIGCTLQNDNEALKDVKGHAIKNEINKKSSINSLNK